MEILPHNIVMVIDDNEIDRYVAQNTILKNGFAKEVISCESAADALDYIANNLKIIEKLPDVIFLDINMPDMNGFDFLKKYDEFPEEIKKNCIIMMLTTSLDTHDKEIAMANRYVSNFINKPLNKEKLVIIGNH